MEFNIGDRVTYRNDDNSWATHILDIDIDSHECKISRIGGLEEEIFVTEPENLTLYIPNVDFDNSGLQNWLATV